MNGLEAFGSLVGLAVLVFPVLVVLALALRGTGGLHLTAHEGLVVAATLTLAGFARGVLGAFTLDDTLFAPLLMALPIAIGLRYGPRVALASTAASWWLLAVLAMANGGAASGSHPEGIGALVVAAGASVLAGVYAAVGARASPLGASVPLVLVTAPAIASPSNVWGDPNVWLGWIATGAWVFLLESRLPTLRPT